MPYSEDFANAGWYKTTPTTLTDVNAVGPDGVSNSAVTISDDGSTGSSSVFVRKLSQD